MEFNVLGPVEMRLDGQGVPLGGTKPRTLLAALLVHHGQVVPTERLFEVLWGPRPPSRARAILQTYVSGLRQLLRPLAGRASITTTPPGYALRLAPGMLDRDVFEELLGAARQATGEGRNDEAAGLLRRALAHWRGPALGGVDSDLLSGEAARLEELRLTAVEERIGADLALDQLSDVAAELMDLVRRHPFRERLRGQLMTALYGLGRQSEALTVYRDGRRNLVEEFGVEPGTGLRTLHTRILRGGSGSEPTAAPSRWDEPPPGGARHHGPPAHVPAQLPAAPADFTGRAIEATQLTTALTRSPAGRQALVQLVVGPAGSGKTALAAHVAHMVTTRYGDGQLYADLRGLDDAPAEPFTILGRFLRALAPADDRLPASTVERAARYRTLLAGRRMLVVLDDARDERQIRPLLPGTATCGVLVTARRRLTGLAGCRVTELDAMPDVDARALLASLIGPRRATAEPEAVQQVLRMCSGLPLALRIAGSRLASREPWPVRLLADRLADERLRLDELSAGDQNVRGSIHRSYRHLDRQQRAALGVSAQLGVGEFPSWILAAAMGVSAAEAERVMEGLVDACLVDLVRIDEVGQARYRLPDLVRIYSRERASGEGPPARAVVARAVAGWRLLLDAARDDGAPPTRQPARVCPSTRAFGRGY
ncbi:BTAD domain-containing putative transcriptional regulator [Micromonospora sp. WMMD737]|uniref:AfsR/SARP family transcriptional regulator n=1 Tax=Micromonospora sp. WMMD737 TaxID=3404113 RepID=UPI003B95FBAB